MEKLFSKRNCTDDYFSSLETAIWPIATVMLIGSAFGVLSNGLIYYAVGKMEFSVGNCYLYVRHLAANQLLCNINFTWLSIMLLIGQFHKTFWNLSQVNCALLASVGTFSMGAGTLIILLMSIDQTFAVVSPKVYVKSRNSLTHISIIFIWICMGIVTVGTVVFADPNHLVPLCIPPLIFTEATGIWWNSVSLVANFMTALIYVTLLILGCKRKRKTTSSNAYSTRSTHIILCQPIILAVHLLSWILAHSIIGLLIFLKADTLTGIIAFASLGLLALVNVNSDIFVYYIRSQSFRVAISRLLKNTREKIFQTTRFRDFERLIT